MRALTSSLTTEPDKWYHGCQALGKPYGTVRRRRSVVTCSVEEKLDAGSPQGSTTQQDDIASAKDEHKMSLYPTENHSGKRTQTSNALIFLRQYFQRRPTSTLLPQAAAVGVLSGLGIVIFNVRLFSNIHDQAGQGGTILQCC